VGPAGRAAAEPGAAADPAAAATGPRYEVVYLWRGRDHAGLRRALAEVGDSVVVVGGDGVYKAHVHTDDPGAATAAAGETPGDVRVTDLWAQVDARCAVGTARAVQAVEPRSPGPARNGRASLIAVVEGRGLAGIFRSLGAEVVPGPAPSDAELAEAVAAAPGRPVFVLPNDPDVLRAAQRVAGARAAGVTVVPARSVPQGIAAAAAFNPLAGVPPDGMLEAAALGVGWGSLSPSGAGGGPTSPGPWLARAAATLVAETPGPGAAAVEVVRSVRRDHHELVTVYAGAAAGGKGELDAILDALREAFPELAVETHHGGQPGDPYLIGVE
jgi:uncharacterized protein